MWNAQNNKTKNKSHHSKISAFQTHANTCFILTESITVVGPSNVQLICPNMVAGVFQFLWQQGSSSHLWNLCFQNFGSDLVPKCQSNDVSVACVLTIHSLKFKSDLEQRCGRSEESGVRRRSSRYGSGRGTGFIGEKCSNTSAEVKSSSEVCGHFKELHCALPPTGTQVCTPSPSRPRNSPPPAYTQPYTCCSRAPHTHIGIWTCSIKWTESIEQKTSCSLQTY